MIKLKKLIKEGPDFIRSQGLTFADKEAYSFYYIKNQMCVGEPGETHEQMLKRTGIRFSDVQYDGRFWKKHKVISFWDYPPKTKLKKIIQNIEKVAKIKIWNDPKWRIETERKKPTYQNYLISLQDYMGSSKPKRTQHVKSPIAKSEKVPKGVGSLKKPKDLKKGETMAQYHFRTRQENILKESPAYIKISGKTLDWVDNEAHPFTYIGNQMFVGSSGRSHSQMIRFMPSSELDRFPVQGKLKYPGRLWKKSKIISFWDYLPPNKLKKVIQDIEKMSKIKIWGDPKWKIEVDKQLIPLRDYVNKKITKIQLHENGTIRIDKFPEGEVDGKKLVKLVNAVDKFVTKGKGASTKLFSQWDIIMDMFDVREPKDIKKLNQKDLYDLDWQIINFIKQHRLRIKECKDLTKRGFVMSKLKNLIPEEMLKEDKTSPWSQQNIKDMNTVTRLGESLTKHVNEINKDLDKLENLWQARRKSTWPGPLETLMLKGQKVGADYVSLETARFNLKQISKWLSEIEKNAGDLLKSISTGKYE